MRALKDVYSHYLEELRNSIYPDPVVTPTPTHKFYAHVRGTVFGTGTRYAGIPGTRTRLCSNGRGSQYSRARFLVVLLQETSDDKAGLVALQGQSSSLRALAQLQRYSRN